MIVVLALLPSPSVPHVGTHARTSGMWSVGDRAGASGAGVGEGGSAQSCSRYFSTCGLPTKKLSAVRFIVSLRSAGSGRICSSQPRT
eukprot:2651670-Prymnesium_polylepis.1